MEFHHFVAISVLICMAFVVDTTVKLFRYRRRHKDELDGKPFRDFLRGHAGHDRDLSVFGSGAAAFVRRRGAGRDRRAAGCYRARARARSLNSYSSRVNCRPT